LPLLAADRTDSADDRVGILPAIPGGITPADAPDNVSTNGDTRSLLPLLQTPLIPRPAM
jgi:hypothetical protein